jgi:hypothetical protein
MIAILGTPSPRGDFLGFFEMAKQLDQQMFIFFAPPPQPGGCFFNGQRIILPKTARTLTRKCL